MRRSGLVVVTSVGLSVLAAACASSGGVSTTAAKTPSTTAGTTAPSTASSTPSTPSAPSAPSASKAGVGDTIDLSDSNSGKKIAVTMVKVVDPDSPGNQFETPPAGDRFESIQFRIVNLGTGTYQDDPLAEITAKDSAGQNMQQEIVTVTAAGAQMPSAVNLAPGDTALGFVTFDVPSGDKVAQAQYSLVGGLGTTGEWQIGNGQALPASPVPASPSPSPTSTPSSSPSANSPQSVVQQYFAAITAHDYAQAWALGGKNVEGGSYNQFVQGFSTTASDDVTIVSVSGDTVTIALDATQTDGTHKFFAGTYTVRNGVIVSADIH